MSSADGSVTRWLGELQAGDPAAAQQLWERYFRRLVGLARKRLRGTPRRAADEEDVALSAFDSFCRSAEQGRFSDIADRGGLWRLLVLMTARKARHLRRDEGRQKRGGGAHFADDTPNDPDEDSVLGQVLGREPTPEFAAQMSEECERLLRILDDAELKDPELKSVALLRMEGYSVEEIAARLGCVARTVKRKLRVIRDTWEKELAP
ncbi:MAG TPA: ECF-type sigma factor [Gemmataceae bacterium]|nr:ECF-type sigma factor [Gemmataceae bacterium]